jgi:adenylate cyclase
VRSFSLSSESAGGSLIPSRQVVGSSSRTATATDQKSIAVLPFVNLSADKNDEYLSDGMTEELLNVLTKVKGLRVPGRSASFAFKGKTEDDIFRKVGDQLHVNAVLEGSVRKAGDKLRITAQLINVADGFHLWSETYDGDMKDILAMQSDVVQRVVKALEVQLGVDEARALAKKPTENAEAYRLYLLGRYHFAKFTRAGWTNAIHYFDQALQVDPAYALAYCGLADTYGWAGGQIVAGKEAWAKEKELALKALALDPSLAEAHLSLGVALFSALDLDASEKELDRAVELNRNLALAYDQYGWTYMAGGRFDEAIAKEKKALELDPLNILFNTDLGFFLTWARRYDEGIVQLRKTLELDANNPLARQTLGWCLHWKGKKAEAVVEFHKAAALDDLSWYKGSLGYAYAASGDRAKAEQVLRDLDEMAKTQYVSPASRASVYLGLGEKAKALDWIEKAYDDRDPLLWWNADRLYDSVRNEPRFQALMWKIEALNNARNSEATP